MEYVCSRKDGVLFNRFCFGCCTIIDHSDSSIDAYVHIFSWMIVDAQSSLLTSPGVRACCYLLTYSKYLFPRAVQCLPRRTHKEARASLSVMKRDSPQSVHLKRGYKLSHGSVCFNPTQIMLRPKHCRVRI